MNYSEWLQLIDLLKKSSKKEYVEKFLNEPINDNLKEHIKPKIIEMIFQRFTNSINNIIMNLEMIFEDDNYLDMELVNFRKSNTTTINLLNNNYLTDEEKDVIKKQLYEDIEQTYKIIEKEALSNDDSGALYQIVKNNRIRRSEDNEL